MPDFASSAKAPAVRHDPEYGASTSHTIRAVVGSLHDALILLARAKARRSVGKTMLSPDSSRAHTVVTVYLHGMLFPPDGADADAAHAPADNAPIALPWSVDLPAPEPVGAVYARAGTSDSPSHGPVMRHVHGALNLVDLAGSESLAKSGAKGAAEMEARAINKSLSSLSDVFQAKAEKRSHVPFRNSKLTHLMEPCLSGRGKTLMLVHVTPEIDHVNETLCTLRFAKSVSQCNTRDERPHTKSQHLLQGPGQAGPNGRAGSSNMMRRRGSY